MPVEMSFVQLFLQSSGYNKNVVERENCIYISTIFEKTKK